MGLWDLAKSSLHDPKAVGTAFLAAGGVGAAAELTNYFFTPKDMFGKKPGQADLGNSMLNTAMNINPVVLFSGEVIPGVKATRPLAAMFRSYGKATSGNPSASDIMWKAAGAGAVTGGVLGIAAGAVLGRRGKGAARAINTISAGLMGAGTGAFLAGKVTVGASRVASDFHKRIRGLDPQRQDHKAFGGGAGYRSWYKQRGGRMPVNHLGSGGDLVLDMHKVRNKSVF